MKSIYSLTLNKLEQEILNLGEKKFKAVQIYDWLYKKRVSSFEEMTNLKKDLIEKLKNNYCLKTLKLIDKREDTLVSKYLFKLFDDNKIEAVLMRHDYGNSLCVSTEVGCNMGCAFCESGRLKKVRILNSNEMVEQILFIEADLNIRITHVVLMGIGEPFDNYDNVMNFIKIINDSKGIQLGSRHITISTCGIIPKIKDFMQENLQVNLAISLHAPNNDLRNKLMPINKAYPLEDLLAILKEYVKKTHRRLTFEYVMLNNINDTKECATQLINLLKGINCYVNLIPYNETSHIEFKRSSNDQVMQFYDILKKGGIAVTVRREFGSKVMAACGQLRSHYEEG